MSNIDSTLAKIADILGDDDLTAEAKTAAVHALTDPETMREHTLRLDRASDALGDTLSALDNIGAASDLGPAEWFREVKSSLDSLADRYWDWLENPADTDDWGDYKITEADNKARHDSLIDSESVARGIVAHHSINLDVYQPNADQTIAMLVDAVRAGRTLAKKGPVS